jgi:hypothetical protein
MFRVIAPHTVPEEEAMLQGRWTEKALGPTARQSLSWQPKSIAYRRAKQHTCYVIDR